MIVLAGRLVGRLTTADSEPKMSSAVGLSERREPVR